MAETIAPCLASHPPTGGILEHRLAALDDAEALRLPEGGPRVVDSHVHLFPDGVFDALWRWFDEHAWPVRYRLYSEQVVAFLRERGLHHIIGLHYAHKPGMARGINQYMADLVTRHPDFVTGVATVLPGEPDALDILDEGFAMGLRGVKLHCHVQAFAPDDIRLQSIYAHCAKLGQPIVMHAGREPRSPAYPVDPWELCSADRVDRVLRDHPTLRLCVPHLGADEYDAYAELLERYDNLWLDTTMAAAAYFPGPNGNGLLRIRTDRIMYGTDFPNIPYAWDREFKQLGKLKLGADAWESLVSRNALRFHSIKEA